MIVLVLAAILATLLVMIGDERGLTALFTLLETIAVMIACLFLIVHGGNVFLVTASCALVLLLLILFAQNGINSKTRASFLAVLIIIAAVGALTSVLIPLFNLGGFGELYTYEEELVFLNSRIGIEAGSLLTGAILFGLLGALTDTALSIATAIAEVHENNRKLSFSELFDSGLAVGRDIIGTMINTLLHAEFGSAFFLWMIFIHSGASLAELINSKSFLQNTLLILVANIGCLAVIPLTAAIMARRLTGAKKTS